MNLPTAPLLPLRIVLAAALASACGGSDLPATAASASPSDEPASVPRAAPAPAAPAAAPVHPAAHDPSGAAPSLAAGDAELEWRWAGAPLSAAVLSEPPASTVDPGGLTCRFAYAAPTRTSTLECVETRSGVRRWGLDVRDGSTAAALLREGETLYAARFDRAGFGVLVERTHLDRGERRWRRALPGLPVPIGGLAVQAIELAREAGAIVVRGWDAGGRWAVALDADAGTVLGARTFEGTGDPSPRPPPEPVASPLATAVPWQWDGPPLTERARHASPGDVSITAGGGRCRWIPEPNGEGSADDRAHLECLDARGARVWGLDDASPWPDMEGRALGADGETLFVLAFHRAASGASVTAYDLATGIERWTSGLTGIGPIGHSIYLAWAQLRLEAGRPVVYGWEAAGRYVEVLDPATGATLQNRVVPDGE